MTLVTCLLLEQHLQVLVRLFQIETSKVLIVSQHENMTTNKVQFPAPNAGHFQTRIDVTIERLPDLLIASYWLH